MAILKFTLAFISYQITGIIVSYLIAEFTERRMNPFQTLAIIFLWPMFLIYTLVKISKDLICQGQSVDRRK